MKKNSAKEKRPKLSELKTSTEFLIWYWLKEEMVSFCKENNLPINGLKGDVQQRIVHFLDGTKPDNANKKQKPKRTSKFNWAKETLTLDTVITDSVTFGMNFRNFMTNQIGSSFVCHSDFMHWVKSHHGATLAEAKAAWLMLEKRKDDPKFKRNIAEQNMLAQYTRDFFEHNPDCTHAQMHRCWKHKKSLPLKNSRVIYENTDRQWL